MSIIDELDELHGLQDLEKEAGLLNWLRPLSKKPAAPVVKKNLDRLKEVPVPSSKPNSVRQELGATQKGFKGETLESRRNYVEQMNPSRATVKDTMPEPRIPNREIGKGSPDPAPTTPATEEKTKWYKDKKIMKGVGIGAVGAAGVGLGVHLLNKPKQEQDAGAAQGYY